MASATFGAGQQKLRNTLLLLLLLASHGITVWQGGSVGFWKIQCQKDTNKWVNYGSGCSCWMTTSFPFPMVTVVVLQSCSTAILVKKVDHGLMPITYRASSRRIAIVILRLQIGTFLE